MGMKQIVDIVVPDCNDFCMFLLFFAKLINVDVSSMPLNLCTCICYVLIFLMPLNLSICLCQILILECL